MSLQHLGTLLILGWLVGAVSMARLTAGGGK
jgi:hypothetical protein